MIGLIEIEIRHPDNNKWRLHLLTFTIL